MKRAIFGGLTVSMLMVCSGCFVNVDLTTTPNPVTAGQPETMKVKVTNPLHCPVGGVVAILFPFVPKDALINEIHDAHLRNEVSGALDAFCSGEPIAGARPDVTCKVDGLELACTIGMNGMPIEAPLPVATTSSGAQVTCESTGTTIVCHIPMALINDGNQIASDVQTGALPDPFPFDCHQVDGVIVCGTLALLPGEMKMDSVVLPAPVPGMYRNFVITIATNQGGVCQNVPLGVPCSIDSQCPTVGTQHCGSGICSAGKLTFGCDVDADCNLPAGFCNPSNHKCLTGNVGATCMTNTDCTAGTCTQCASDTDGELLPGVACTNTDVTNPATAPAMSPWGIGITMVGLLGAATFSLRRRARRR